MRSRWDVEALVKKCRAGDSDAWNSLVDQCQALVYSIAIKHGLESDDAADVFQVTFQALYSSLDRIRVDATVPKWLAVTAARESLQIIRRRKRMVETDDSTLEEVLESEEKDAEVSALESWQSVALKSAIGEMAGRCRDLLRLLYYEEMPYEKIADETGIPVGAIGPTRSRCLDKLRKTLLEQDFFG